MLLLPTSWLAQSNISRHLRSLFHASYSGVTLALIHGGAPDALVLCHEPTRTHMRGLPNYSLPTLENLRETAVAMARVVNPKAQAVGVAINTKALDADAARNLCERTEAELGLPTVDPFRDGADRLAEAMQLKVVQERFALDGVFTISRGSRTHADVVAVSLSLDGHTGRGECLPYARYSESLDGVQRDIESMAERLGDGLTREELQAVMPAGAARNALDCALWDLQAKQTGTPVWALAGLSQPQSVTTAYTLSLASPAEMEHSASQASQRPLLKIKLGGEGDLERLAAVRRGAPHSRLIVDANEGWSVADYQRLAPHLLELGVALVEQPLPAGDDESLGGRSGRPTTTGRGSLTTLAVQR